MDDRSNGTTANRMWGGRFTRGPAEVMARINPSIGFDKRLYRQDIAASVVHARMLARQGIIPEADAAAIVDGLARIEREIDEGRFVFRDDLEDIHMNVEARLKDLIGDAAGRLHTARSRNDQAVTDVRLWMRDAVDQRLDPAMAALQAVLMDRAEEHAATVMPGFTHLQVAQPVTLGHHLMAYVEMFGRDRERLAGARSRINVNPLGAAALAGTAFPIDRDYTSAGLGFSGPTANSMDSVAARDHIAELLFVCSMFAVHLSRLAEDLTLWCSDGFRFVALSDAFTTGSSIMPQKRNPDAAELVRGKAGRVVGALTALLVTMKGLPMTFMKDMQEDKEPMFDAVDTVALCAEATAGMIADMRVREAEMRAFLTRGFATATDLADWLVREAGVPFREAHHITARIVARAEADGVTLDQLPPAVMREIDGRIGDGVTSVLSVDRSVASRRSHGGTAPETVREAIRAARKRWG
ncbi:MAG: argininosuccinate lyase [Ferrovibrionaceae bacterium]